MDSHDIVKYDLSSLRLLLQQGEITPEDIIQAYINHINVIQPTINGFVQNKFDIALDKAMQQSQQLSTFTNPPVFFGLPFGLKDCFEVEGYVTTFGSMSYANHISTYSATVVNKLEQAGGNLLGLTNTPEIGTSIETDNIIYGRTNNPINLAHTCGGSSGGGAALVKANALPCVIGSDFGGGSRNAAHCCGLFAHRPSYGRVSSAGYLFGCSGIKGRMCRLAPIARSVSDLSLIFKVINGEDMNDPKTSMASFITPRELTQEVRIALVGDHHLAPVQQEIYDAVANFGKALDKKFVVEQINAEDLFSEGNDICRALFTADAGKLLEKVLTHKDISPSMTFWLDTVSHSPEISASDFIVLMSRWDDHRLKVNRLFEQYDFLICPSAPTVAPKHGETFNKTRFWQNIFYTLPFSLTQSPVLVVPVGVSNSGLPISVQIVATAWSDEKLLSFGEWLETDETRSLIQRSLTLPHIGA